MCVISSNALKNNDALYTVLQTYEDTAPDQSTKVIKRKKGSIIDGALQLYDDGSS